MVFTCIRHFEIACKSLGTGRLVSTTNTVNMNIVLFSLRKYYPNDKKKKKTSAYLDRIFLIIIFFFFFQGRLMGSTDAYFSSFRRCNYPKLTADGAVVLVHECGRYARSVKLRFGFILTSDSDLI